MKARKKQEGVPAALPHDEPRNAARTAEEAAASDSKDMQDDDPLIRRRHNAGVPLNDPNSVF